MRRLTDQDGHDAFVFYRTRTKERQEMIQVRHTCGLHTVDRSPYPRHGLHIGAVGVRSVGIDPARASFLDIVMMGVIDDHRSEIARSVAM